MSGPLMAGRLRGGRRARAGSAGVTLIELLSCIALLSLAVMLALPHLAGGTGSSLQLAAEARMLGAVLRSARETALSERRSVTVTFDRAGLRVSWSPAQSRRLVSVQRLNVITARGPAETPEASIVFAPDGGSSGGVVIMEGGGSTRRLTVDWLTGAVSMDER